MNALRDHAIELLDDEPQTRTTSVVVTPTPGALLQLAVEQGADLDKLERLMALQERWEATEARKAYTRAMADFKLAAPRIAKDKTVGYKNRDGTLTGYTHATLGNVTATILGALAKHGFSHRWDVAQPGGGQVVVRCVLTHSQGHSETTVMSGGLDDSGKKNPIQQIASTVTYLQRYTLLAAVGMATDDQDDDGAAQADEAAQRLATWITKVRQTGDTTLLAQLRKEANAEFAKAQDLAGWTELKRELEAQRTALETLA